MPDATSPDLTFPHRYHVDRGLHQQPDTSLKHFLPVDGRRDRFGNEAFASKTSAYLDREGELVKSAMLVSPEGRAFVTANHGILSDIDKGLVQLEHALVTEPGSQFVDKIADLGKGRKMYFLEFGSQSTVYVLEVGGDKYVVKTKTLKPTSISQPYVNEMLQVQSAALDLHDDLVSFGIRMPTFLFATGEMSCTRFEEGGEPDGKDFTNDRQIMAALLMNYVGQQERGGNALWKNIEVDWKQYGPTQTDNFIKKPDGTLVFIDPFWYVPYGSQK